MNKQFTIDIIQIPKITHINLKALHHGNSDVHHQKRTAKPSVLFGQYGERGFSPLFRCFVSILRATCGGQNTLGKILSFPQIPSKKNNQVKIMNFEKSEI